MESPPPYLETTRLLPLEPRTRTVLSPPPTSNEVPGGMTPFQRNIPPSVTPVPSLSALVPQSLGEGMATASTPSQEIALPLASGPSEASPPATMEGTTEAVALHHTPPVEGEGPAQPPPPPTPPSQSSPAQQQQVSERLPHTQTQRGTPPLPLDTSPPSQSLPMSPPEPPSTQSRLSLTATPDSGGGPSA